MTIIGYRRLTTVLIIGVVLRFVLSASLFWKYARQRIEIEFAEERTEIFEAMRTRALQINPVGAADCLGYVTTYYPSGTKQRTGSLLDKIVERERTRAIRDIIAHLRTTTGQDLGDEPEKWIKWFEKK
jgi:hypothetical protein